MVEESAEIISLNDHVVDDPAVIGPIELRVRGRWDRVERALSGLPHQAVRYSWRYDSTGEPALYIEVPLSDEASADDLLGFRDSIRAAVAELEPERSVYVHFVGAEAIGA